MEDLRHHLAHAQVSHKTHLPRGAKHATHRAARLRAHAHGGAPRVAHEHRLDGLPVGQPEEKLLREPIAASGVGGDRRRFEEKATAHAQVLGQPARQGRGKFRAPWERERGVALHRPPQRARVDAA